VNKKQTKFQQKQTKKVDYFPPRNAILFFNVIIIRQ
jgi:hypothetical protein